jgi:hypothetical protein
VGSAERLCAVQVTAPGAILRAESRGPALSVSAFAPSCPEADRLLAARTRHHPLVAVIYGSPGASTSGTIVIAGQQKLAKSRGPQRA